MQNDMIKQFNEMNQNVVEFMKELTSINTQMMQKITERQMATAGAYSETFEKQLEAMKSATSTQDLIAAQAALAKEFNEKMLANAQQTMDILVQTRTELTAWVEKGMQAAAKAAEKK